MTADPLSEPVVHRLWLDLTGAARSVVTPCRTQSELWHAEKRQDREKAAALCGGCPLLRACDDYATAADERFGVFGGRDRTPLLGRRKGVTT